MQKIEDALRREFPNTDLKANPHIQSKMHTWKKIYGALSQVLSRSGIGFNLHGDYKIDCDEAEWSEILKVCDGCLVQLIIPCKNVNIFMLHT